MEKSIRVFVFPFVNVFAREVNIEDINIRYLFIIFVFSNGEMPVILFQTQNCLLCIHHGPSKFSNDFI